uniref:Transport n=1 Tax=uncultured Thiotrichaceae bacterium TaxID=298394 RepID=A0A6S6U580_9GAMM|nr:MAG: Putative transport [uncultured Thiotrichaceae bacterium]
MSGIERDEADQIKESAKLEAKTVYMIISKEGEDELKRPFTSLWWSGLAAGVAISSSLWAKGMLLELMPETEWETLLVSFGYCVGFIIVILGRLQLFTENTITPILPLFANFSYQKLWATASLWGIVLCANLTGTFLSAAAADLLGIATPEQLAAVQEISKHFVLDNAARDIFLQGIPAGFYVAALVWILPSAKGFELSVIVVLTYLIAIGGFSHVIVGSTEVFLVMLDGKIGLIDAFGGVLLPALLGNIIGGTGLFSMLAYVQVKNEI